VDITDLDAHKTGGFPPDYPTDRRTFFAPVDDVHGALLAVLSSATKSLSVAMYGWDDDEFQQVILDKMKAEGVVTQITLDSSQAGGKHEAALLATWLDPAVGTPLTSVVSVGRSERGAIMHLKAVVVDGEWVVTGSTNWSDGGEGKQDNQLTITHSRSEAYELQHRLDGIHLAQLQAAAAKAQQ
jgi:phosphatidylserine/phosphatidylglycerophosphate/cardiolipin synthase-like enzyme